MDQFGTTNTRYELDMSLIDLQDRIYKWTNIDLSDFVYTAVVLCTSLFHRIFASCALRIKSAGRQFISCGIW